jgi:DNA-binding MarR family transcriptional regulator
VTNPLPGASRTAGPAGPAAEVVLPALLRAARGTYSDAVRLHLSARGFSDLPRNGPHVLGGMANRGGTAAGLIRELRITKQAASQLIDVLVVRGYLDRRVDPADRRRVTIELTERGRAAAAAVRAGVEDVDGQLAELCTPAELAGLRAGLVALTEIRERAEEAERGTHGS